LRKVDDCEGKKILKKSTAPCTMECNSVLQKTKCYQFTFEKLNGAIVFDV